MDLLSIVQAAWRHKIAAIPVMLLTALGVFYVIAIKAPVYQAPSSVLLVNPPGPPTAAQIAADPKLGNINTNNPYTNLGSLPVVADVVINLLTGDASQQALLAAGADPRYKIGLSPDAGSPPIILITGVGSSPQEAIRTANLVAKAAKTELHHAQARQGVNDLYMIKTIELVRPHHAQLSASGKLRSLIAVLGLGGVLLFVVVSVSDVLDKRRLDKTRLKGSSTADPPVRAQRKASETDEIDTASEQPSRL